MNDKLITPQAGFQMNFLKTPADVAVGGGSAGAGKSFALLLEFTRHAHRQGWNGVIFRRTLQQVVAQGGLWDTAEGLFTSMLVNTDKGVKPIAVKQNKNSHTFTFAKGATLQFSHLQHEKDKTGWQGSQIGYLGFDELTHFTESQFFYLLTRNRSTSGISPYTRATLNPQGEGWCKDMISWYLYPDDYPDTKLAGLPIPERAGNLRYFTRYKGKYIWGNTKHEVLDLLPADVARGYTLTDIKSFTFIPGTLEDNKILMSIDPSYRANLLAQDEVLVEQLLGGRWLADKNDRSKLFDKTALLDMFSNSFVPLSTRYITADIALEGNDKFVVIVWEGWRAIDITIVDRLKGNKVIETIRSLANVYAVPNSRIAFDADGVGNFASGYLRGAVAVHNNARPVEIENTPQNYMNLKAQMYYHLSQRINNYEVFVNIDNENLITEISEELYAHKKVITNEGKLGITKKDAVKAEIGRSPDLADALALRSIFDFKKKSAKRSTASFD